ncbi:MAG: hypothetical protein PUI85_01175 [Eubacteriales bacterium]|nr:hypothetical protein [Eubacteriales bacterium]MDY3332999.1 hypothetical protein [Gallibacter sp.]
MLLTLLYFSAASFGIYIGHLMHKKNKEIKSISKIQIAMIIFLISAMGAKIGNNKEIIDSLGTIGLSSFLIVSMAIIFSIILVFIFKRLLKMGDGEE